MGSRGRARPVASSQSAGGTRLPQGGHEDRSVEGARIEVPIGTGVPLPNRLRAGVDPGVEIRGACI